MGHRKIDARCCHWRHFRVLQNTNSWEIWDPFVSEGITDLPRLLPLLSSPCLCASVVKYSLGVGRKQPLEGENACATATT